MNKVLNVLLWIIVFCCVGGVGMGIALVSIFGSVYIQSLFGSASLIGVFILLFSFVLFLIIKKKPAK